MAKFHPEASVRLFNEALALLFRHFSDRPFNRTAPVTTTEVEAQPRSYVSYISPRCGPGDTPPDGVNIFYCPPSTYSRSVDVPLLHVRTYDPDEAEPVAKLLRGLGLKPRVTDNDPYSKMDIDAELRRAV